MNHIDEGWLYLIVEAKQLGLTHEQVRGFIKKWGDGNDLNSLSSLQANREEEGS